MSGVKMNHTTIVNKVKTFAKEIWGLDFNTRIELSGKMTRLLGYVQYNPSTHKPTLMKIATRLVNGDYKEETIDSVLLHETCHWALMMLDKPHSDGHPYFEAELRKIGASSTRTIKNAGENHTFKCTCCNTIITLPARKANNLIPKLNAPYNYPVTKCCRARLQYIGKTYIEDSYKNRVASDAKAKEVVAAMSIAKPEIEKVKTNKTSIVVPKGPNKKVTNNTLMEVVKRLIKENNLDGVKEVRNQYPQIFASSLKYLSKKEQEIISKL
jgi:predicted SprT family Zn-dependent metalloprotease